MSLSRTYDGPMPKLLLGGLVALLAAGLLWPLAELALLVVAEGAGAAAFLTPYNLRAVGNTIVMGAVVALTATVLGFVVAYAITVTRSQGLGAFRSIARIVQCQSAKEYI
jgi:ABC-type Fe3+ transport system permease subunit